MSQLNMSLVNYYKNVHNITERFPKAILDIMWEFKVGIEIFEFLEMCHHSANLYSEKVFVLDGEEILSKLYCFKLETMVHSLGLPVHGIRERIEMTYNRDITNNDDYLNMDVNQFLTGNQHTDYEIVKSCFIAFIELLQSEPIIRKSSYHLDMDEWMFDGMDDTSVFWLGDPTSDWRKDVIFRSISDAKVFPKTK